MLMVGAEQEDELRAFCNLVSRRAPHANEIAWVLRRFELGCERASEYEAISDHLLALRALLGAPSELEPAGMPDGLLAGRLAALCATPEQRAVLAERTLKAIALERQAIAGVAEERMSAINLARELSDHLRALLRDVVCGHLPADLRLARLDELLLAGNEEGEELGEQQAPVAAAADTSEPRAGRIVGSSGEQALGDDAQAAEDPARRRLGGGTRAAGRVRQVPAESLGRRSRDRAWPAHRSRPGSRPHARQAKPQAWPKAFA